MKKEVIHYDGMSDWCDEDIFYLDHSCGDWMIGNLEDAKAFYEELGNKIQQVEFSNNN